MELHEGTFLVVDDEVMLCRILAKMLVKAGCGTVLQASNGKEALAVIETTEVDVLITDVRMPLMDGVTLVRELARRQKALRAIVMISGFADLDRREMYSLGVEAFLPKPFDSEELMTALNAVVAAPSSRWLYPMEIAPKCSVEKVFSRFSDHADETSISLGRGGMSLQPVEPVRLGKISFDCHTDGRVLKGQGNVRWKSANDGLIGVEFIYLEPFCTQWIWAEIARRRPTSHIPFD